jgi:hypothetical protein
MGRPSQCRRFTPRLFISSASHLSHLRLSCEGVRLVESASGMRITWLATRSASCSSGSLACPTISFACMASSIGDARGGNDGSIRWKQRDFTEIP